MRVRDEAPGRIAGKGDKAEEEDDEASLDGRGNAQTAQLGAVVDEQVAITEQCRRRGQKLGH